ncbi:MAG: aminopeptidase [Lachnospiraceae bacterium]|nr:aminopeptidase [Lachnospiraceae bacterium]
MANAFGENMSEKETAFLLERLGLAAGRIGEIGGGEEAPLPGPFGPYFLHVAQFARQALADFLDRGEHRGTRNMSMYGDILPEHYDASYANPAYAARQFGHDVGQLLSCLYCELRGMACFAADRRLKEATCLAELFLEVYGVCAGALGDAGTAVPVDEGSLRSSIHRTMYAFYYDNMDWSAMHRVRETLVPGGGGGEVAYHILGDADLADTSYLFLYGDFIGPVEEQTAAFLNGLPQEDIDRMAGTFAQGYVKGFQVTGVDLSGKRTVAVRYPIGFERMVRKAAADFMGMGLTPIFPRSPLWLSERRPDANPGYHATGANPQCAYDHRYDIGLFWDRKMKNRRLDCLRRAYEAHREWGRALGGPAVVEIFGEPDFAPQNNPDAVAFTSRQTALWQEYRQEAAALADGYFPVSETSFTIIAFPVPTISEDFAEIFRETIRINTLDMDLYRGIQQTLIDVLDGAVRVEVKGGAGNLTDLTVALRPMVDRAKETNFENCLADVNIPLGEVFTSPRLSGTEGILHVASAYIGGIRFEDLKVWFRDGFAVDYDCGNFASRPENKSLVKQVILKDHDRLPLGEFAIGTNTAAYAMSRRYGILEKLPILIVEKMGPHFALGDTCYSRAEDKAVYNPDGKEIAARDNEVSALRHTDPGGAYFNCHTDITLPYEQLGELAAVDAGGGRVAIIRDGRFALPGTEALNVPLDGIP